MQDVDLTYCKKGIVITTDSLLFQIQMSEQKQKKTTWQSFPHAHLHIIIPSWQLTLSMHQIGSLICNQPDKLMVRMTILFLPFGLGSWSIAFTHREALIQG